VQPKEPENLDVAGLLKGIYHLAAPPEVSGNGGHVPRVQLLASGVGLPWVTDAARMLAEEWGVAADTWSVTSWNELARDAVATEQWNLNHPSEAARTPYVTNKLKEAEGPIVAVSDYMRAVPYQIAKWVPADYHVLGAEGFGFADTRPAARRFFQIDAQSVVVQALAALAERGEVKQEVVQEAFDRYRIDDPTAVAGVKQEGGDA
jgi:pyruvate dehydrogenase E1 component